MPSGLENNTRLFPRGARGVLGRKSGGSGGVQAHKGHTTPPAWEQRDTASCAKCLRAFCHLRGVWRGVAPVATFIPGE